MESAGSVSYTHLDVYKRQKVDFAAALLDIRTTTARDWPRLPADVQKLFTAYAAGLNHYADKHPDEVRLSGLFPVTGEDVVAGFVLRSPFFFGLDSVLGSLVEDKPIGREGGPALDAKGKLVQRELTPVGRDRAGNGSNGMAAVSYTHLDVYQRQHLPSLRIAASSSTSMVTPGVPAKASRTRATKLSG